MPAYEFECLKCKKTFVETLSLAEYEKKAKIGFACPKCGSEKVEQLVGVEIKTSKKS